MGEGVRIVPLISSKQLTQVTPVFSELPKNNYIPLRFNQAGVMPIILTTAVLVIPNYINSLGLLPIITLPSFMGASKFIYWISYFSLIIVFSSFYSNIILNPKDIASELQKMSVSIPGVRPGIATTYYLKQVMKRVTFLGALMLVGVILDLSREIRSILLSNIYNNMFN